MSMESAIRTFTVPSTEAVIYGIGAISEIASLRAVSAASRVVVVRPDFLAGSAVEDSVTSHLGVPVTCIDSVPQHVPMGAVIDLASRLRELQADCVISLGGGTAIDAVKAASLSSLLDVQTRDGFATALRGPLAATRAATRPFIHVAVPTTLSGAEHTPLVGITDEVSHEKMVLNRAELAPDAVVLDPTVTLATPRELWLSSGIRAVDHAVEGQLCIRRMPFMDALGSHALSVLADALPRTTADPDDLQARLDCMVGTWLSIFALPNAGVGLSHGIGHQLAAEFDLLHGVTSAIMLPWVMDFGAQHTAPQLRRVASALGEEGAEAMGDDEAAQAAVARVRSLIQLTGVPYRLRDCNVDRSRLVNVARNTMHDPSVAASPRQVTQGIVLELLHRAW